MYPFYFLIMITDYVTISLGVYLVLWLFWLVLWCVGEYVGVFWQLCGCFGNMCTSIYLFCIVCTGFLYCFVYIHIFTLISFICTSVRTTATERQLNNNNNNNNRWNVKTKAIPVIIGATGIISKSFRKYVSNISGKHEVKQPQKTAILGTAHILRKVLM